MLGSKSSVSQLKQEVGRVFKEVQNAFFLFLGICFTLLQSVSVRVKD